MFPDLKHYVSKFELSFVKIKFYEGAGKFHLSSKVIKTLLIHKKGYKTLLEKTKQYWVNIKFTRKATTKNGLAAVMLARYY